MNDQPTTSDTRLADTQRMWELLTEQVEAFAAAWAEGSAPPLDGYLPAKPLPARRLILAELIKVDLENRWTQGIEPRRLEDYAREFPELVGSRGIPADLIYEEFHIRKQAGIEVDPQEYFQRFPGQSQELIRLLGLESPRVTTSVIVGDELETITPGQQIEDFDLLVLLGKGAFASVYLARQRSMQRLVALKISSDRGNEPQTLAQLDHPYIVRVFDQRMLPDKRIRLLYMQYVAGGTLRSAMDYLRKLPRGERSGRSLLRAIDQELESRGEAPLSDARARHFLARATWPQAVCWIGARLASALDYAHAQGVLHRDIKPANVLLAADASPKLVDFNISFSTKVAGSSPAAYFGGSLAYMSPEQLEACNPAHDREPDELDGRSDIYALGVVLWELLTGERPFDDSFDPDDRSSLLTMMAGSRRTGLEAVHFERLPDGCPPGLEQVLKTALAPEPSQRFATAGQMARQLELCLHPQTQRLLRPPRASWRNRMRTLPGAVTALAFAAIAPNVLYSYVNIQYNLKEIVEDLGASVVGVFQSTDLIAINAAFYLCGLMLGCLWCWPVLKAVAAIHSGEKVDPAILPPLRWQALSLGYFISLMIVGLWLISAIVFPAWLGVYIGSLTGLGAVKTAHFALSQLVCGLLATTQAYFGFTFLMVRNLYPVLLQPDAQHADDPASVERLVRRSWTMLGIATLVPLLTLLALFVREPSQRLLFATLLGGLSLFGVALAFVSLRAILADLAALTPALSPAGEGSLSASDSFSSLSTGSRR